MQGGLPAGLHESDTASASEPVTDRQLSHISVAHRGIQNTRDNDKILQASKGEKRDTHKGLVTKMVSDFSATIR